MKPLDARNEHYTLVDVDGYICLFTNMRLDRETIPDDIYCYDVRDDCGDGSFAQIQKSVLVDFWGSILTKDSIPLDPQWHCYWPERDAEYYPNESFTLEQFRTTPVNELLILAQGDSLSARMQEAHERAVRSQNVEVAVVKEDPTRE